MNLIFRKITEHKIRIIIIFILLSALAVVGMQFTSVNYNLMDYLPNDAKSTISLEIMEEEFNQDIPNVNLMIYDVSITKALEYKNKLKEIDGIDEIKWLDDEVNLTVPIETLEKETLENWYKDNNALFSITIEKENQTKIIENIRDSIDEEVAMSGSSVNTSAAKTSTNVELKKSMVLIIIIVLSILFLTTSSWIEPILFLLTIGSAILLNNGTNFFLGEISFVTKASSSILQLAVSMDYSIFLLHRFSEYRKDGLDVKKSMIKSLNKTITSISASGMTTIIGFLALILMRFRIGSDMGIVLAKSIVFSLICVLTLLPALTIVFYKLIEKTKHSTNYLNKITSVGRHITKFKFILIIILVVISFVSILAQSNNNFLYGSSKIFTEEDTRVVKERIEIENIFGSKNQLVLMVPEGDFSKEKNLSEDLHNIDEITSIISYIDSVDGEIPEEFLSSNDISQLISEKYSRFIITLDTEVEGKKTFEILENIEDITSKYYLDEYYLTGESISAYDLKNIVISDNVRVNLVAIAAIGIILLIIFKSVTLPLILLFIIEASIWINLAIPYFKGESVYYIAYLIINSVQLGATVDYAILFASRYLENRKSNEKNKAVIKTIKDTIISILTSASILTFSGVLLGTFSSNGVISQLGFLVGRGATISTILVLFFLPCLFVLMDKIIIKTTLKLKFEIISQKNKFFELNQ
jgi:predicted RND superfamily exporter protein